MSSVKKVASQQALRHAEEFWDENEWADILEKYAEVFNKAHKAANELAERAERGARIEDDDEADYYYFDTYSNLLACWIANNELTRNGYERDKDKFWILKKKRGFWR